MIASQISSPAAPDHFPGGENKNLFFNCFEGSNEEKKSGLQKEEVL